MEELKKLYDLLKENYQALSNDLSFDEPYKNVNTTFPESYKHLATQHSVCCEQKIIYWDENTHNFIVSCLYNSHPTLRYSTKEEVLSFFEGYSDSFAGFCQYEYKDEPKPYQDALYLMAIENVNRFSNHFNKNVTDNIKYGA